MLDFINWKNLTANLLVYTFNCTNQVPHVEEVCEGHTNILKVWQENVFVPYITYFS